MEWVIVFGEFPSGKKGVLEERYSKMTMFTYENDYKHNYNYRLVFEGTEESCDNILLDLSIFRRVELQNEDDIQ